MRPPRACADPHALGAPIAHHCRALVRVSAPSTGSIGRLVCSAGRESDWLRVAIPDLTGPVFLVPGSLPCLRGPPPHSRASGLAGTRMRCEQPNARPDAFRGVTSHWRARLRSVPSCTAADAAALASALRVRLSEPRVFVDALSAPDPAFGDADGDADGDR